MLLYISLHIGYETTVKIRSKRKQKKAKKLKKKEKRKKNTMPNLLFAHDMQVEVPEGTVLCFNPSSFSSDKLRVMSRVQFLIGGVVFEAKKEVLENVSDSYF